MVGEPEVVVGAEVDDAAAVGDLDDRTLRGRDDTLVLEQPGRGDFGELVTKTEEDLLNITNFGQKSLEEVTAKLDELGLSLRRGTDAEGGA